MRKPICWMMLAACLYGVPVFLGCPANVPGPQGERGPTGDRGEAGAAGPRGDTGPASTADIVALNLELDEMAGTTFADTSGFGNEATAPISGIAVGSGGHTGKA